jgi:Ser/Thr protein kinase RdoA (MazF antagonist)
MSRRAAGSAVTDRAAHSGLDPGRIASTVAGLPGWRRGPIHVERAIRIGVEHGLSGAVYRVSAKTATLERVTLIVKEDDAAGIERALAFHSDMGERLVGWIPACYGGEVDVARGSGTLYLEDVAPARQGDVLEDPGDDAAQAAIRTIARVHAASWRPRPADHGSTLPRWKAEAWDDERWRDRLIRARARFPDVLIESLERQLLDLPRQVAAAVPTLAAGPASWIHGDAHLDNVMWRPNGRAVLVDWAGATIGPPAVDIARFLVEGPPGVSGDSNRSAALIEAYQEQLRSGGVPDAAASAVPRFVELGLLPLVQGIVGWAGRPEDHPPQPRTARLRENALRSVVARLNRDD